MKKKKKSKRERKEPILNSVNYRKCWVHSFVVRILNPVGFLRFFRIMARADNRQNVIVFRFVFRFVITFNHLKHSFASCGGLRSWLIISQFFFFALALIRLIATYDFNLCKISCYYFNEVCKPLALAACLGNLLKLNIDLSSAEVFVKPIMLTYFPFAPSFIDIFVSTDTDITSQKG